jgi:trehalose synthase
MPDTACNPRGGVARLGEALAEIPLETRDFEDLGRYLLMPMMQRVRVARQRAGELLGGRTVWMVNSAALGGGVAQMLRTLLPYWKGAGIDVRWVVLRGSAEFFRVTKRLHNHLHGEPGDGDVLGIEELTTLDQAALYHVEALTSLLSPGDVVVLHDPQTAAMSVPLERTGATVIWRCHIGIDHHNEYSRNAWRCLRPRLAGVRHFVFSRYASLPEWLGGPETSIVTPGIDPRSTKNLPMPYGAARAIVQQLGVAAGVPPAAAPRYARPDGSVATLATGPTVVDSDGPPDWGRDPVVVSLARWDRIKDPLGILDGFVERVVPATGAHLLLAGPDASQVADDPEAEAVFAGVRDRWRRLPPWARARVHLACFPLTPPEENAAMVNAIQRLAAVVVKKSVQEGFGLGVTEAMWKARPVVASAVGGHLEQVQHRNSGLLVDPGDVAAFGDAIVELLRDPPLAARLGQAGRERVRALFLNDRHFVRWIDVFGAALEPRAGATRSTGSAAGEPTPPWRDAAALDLADHDALTGLWNRRGFENELDRARQNAERLALLSIDVDRYNEAIRRHGAASAEGLIQSIAQVLAQRLRPNETLARMGGDEFAAVFHAATPSLIQSLADGLCAAVREQSHVVGTSRIPATISIGVVFFDPGTQTPHEALRAADAALHEAKVAGGDRAIVHQS